MQTQGFDISKAPRYRLLSPAYLEDDTLHSEGEEIIYLGTPNEEMEPLNDAAVKESTAFINRIDDAAAVVAAARNMPFMGRQALMEQAMEHAMQQAKELGRALVLPQWRGDVPERPDLATPQQRRVREMRDGKKVLGTKAPVVARGKGNAGGPAPVLGSGLSGQALADATAGKPPLG